jgi:hypothetical protein
MKTREDILTLIPPNSICAEIGVFEGDFSEYILSIANPKGLHLVDLFEGQMCSGNKNGENMKYIMLEDAYNALNAKYLNNPKVRLFKGLSTTFLQGIPDHYLDFIYIDGDHSYEGCKADLALAKLKVKPGGIIAGHDYCDLFIGVLTAVNEFVDLHKLDIKLTTEDKIKSFYMLNT